MTTSSLLCPQCGTALDAAARLCPGCGVDVAIVALLLEHSAAQAVPPQAPFAPDIFVPRLGEFLLKRQYVTEAQLQQALEHQRKTTEAGKPQTLGESLVELGLISRQNLDRAILAQVLELQAALQASNRQLEARVAQRTAELERALNRISEVNQLKANFIANVSHELRTPLGQIKGYTVLLNDGALGPLSEEQADAIRAAVGAVERLERLIEDLIRFAATTRGEIRIETSVFCLTDVAQSTLHRAGAKAARGDVHLRGEIPPQPIFAEGDAEKLRWVLFQLVDNAIKFTPSGGSVTLTLTPDAEAASVRVCVQDTGIGIPAERIPELFQPFHQLDGSSTRRYGGTGLGLALVRRIIEAHRTEINIESTPARGSAFSFVLPAHKA